MKLYCKNGFIQCREVPERETITAGGIVLLKDQLSVGPQGHEVEVMASATADLSPGDRVIVSVAGISAWHTFDGEQVFSIPEKEVWAKVSMLAGGMPLPRHGQLLTERNDSAMRRYAFGNSPLFMPTPMLEHGLSASGESDPQRGGSRARDAITVLYETVAAVGPDAAREVMVGEVVCFSPSYCSTRIQRQFRNKKKTVNRYFHLVPAAECFFTVGG